MSVYSGLLVRLNPTVAPQVQPSKGRASPGRGHRDRSPSESDNLDDEAEEGGLVHELGPVVGTVGEQMLDPWPALADGIEDHLGASAVGEIGRALQPRTISPQA